MKQEYSVGEQPSLFPHRHCNGEKPSVDSTLRPPLRQNTNQKPGKSNVIGVAGQLSKDGDVSQLYASLGHLSPKKEQNTEYETTEQLARDLTSKNFQTVARAFKFFDGLTLRQKQMALASLQILRDEEKDQHQKVLLNVSLKVLKKSYTQQPNRYISQKSGFKSNMGKPQPLLSQSTTHDKGQKINNGSSQVQHGDPLQRNIGSTCASFFSKLGRLFTVGPHRKTEDRQFAQPSQQQQLEPLSDKKKVS